MAKRARGEGVKYLDQIQRNLLDFDFEKVCSVTLQTLNVYACLVCGRYFQGRAPGTPAHTHALLEDHRVFLHLKNKTAWCLPEGEALEDPSLDDILYLLDPTFTPEDVHALDHSQLLSLTLDGKPYTPGVVGLNDISHNDALNCVLLALAHIGMLRDFFLIPTNYASCTSPLVRAFGEFVRRVWNRRNFKAQVSPHEMLNAVSLASGKRFQIGVRADPILFLGWIVNELHVGLLGGTRKGATVVTRALQGKVHVTTEKNVATDAEKEAGIAQRIETTQAESNFFFLTLDLPAAPLFKDELERNIIPQVPLMVLLRKFDGNTWTELPVEHMRKRFVLTLLPPYIVLHVKRFTHNRFFLEKNPTIVTFPVRSLDFSPYLRDATGPAKYDLVSVVRHEGDAKAGKYVASVLAKGNSSWFDVDNLAVSETHAQKLYLSESYLLVYERAIEE